MTNAPRSITEPQFSGIGRQRCSLCGQEMHGADHAELQRQRIAELTKRKCGTCAHFKKLDYRVYCNDPSAVWTICTWKPVQPFWMNAEYMEPNMAAVRKPGDGENCPVWHEGVPSA